MSISGSGDGGRIIKSDVEKAIRQPHAQGATITKTYISGRDELIPLSQIRKTIARRLSESKNGAPHFYVTIEVNMENAIQAREVLNNKGDLKISFNDLIVKAVSAALKKHKCKLDRCRNITTWFYKYWCCSCSPGGADGTCN